MKIKDDKSLISLTAVTFPVFTSCFWENNAAPFAKKKRALYSKTGS